VPLSPSGLKIRAASTSASDWPVTASTTIPSSTVLVLLYWYCSPGRNGGWTANEKATSCCGVQTCSVSSAKISKNPGCIE
jgi:hypothetical protein